MRGDFLYLMVIVADGKMGNLLREERTAIKAIEAASRCYASRKAMPAPLSILEESFAGAGSGHPSW